MSDLKKLFTYVPINQCDNFRQHHIASASESDPYWNKIVFLKDTEQIWTRGTFWSSSVNDVTELKNILSGFSYDGNTNPNKTVKDSLDEILAGLTNTGILTISRDADGITTYSSALQLTALTENDAYTGVIRLEGGEGFTSYDVVFANTGDKIDTGSYAGATSYAIKEYVENKISALESALEFKGPISASTMQTILENGSKGDVYVASEYFTYGSDNIEEGDMVILTTDAVSGTPSEYMVVERNLDNAVTAYEKLTANHVVLGYANNSYMVKTSEHVLGSDDTTAASFGTANTLATEVAVSTYVNNIVDNLDATVEGSNTYLAYTVEEENGVLTGVNVTAYLATVSYADGAMTVSGTGLLDHVAAEAINSYIAYVGSLADNASSILDGLDAESTYTGDYLSYNFVQENGLVTSAYVTVTRSTVAQGADGNSYTFTTGLLDETAGEKLNAYIAYVGNLVDSLDDSYTTVESASSYFWFEDNGEENDHNYVLNAYVQTLGDAIGMRFDPVTGRWYEGSTTVEAHPGLAYAYNVAYEIVKDEKVIAAALNDHEERIDNLETSLSSFAIGTSTPDQLTVTYSGGTYTLGITYTQSESDIVETSYDVVTANVLAYFIDHPWEEYNGEA